MSQVARLAAQGLGCPVKRCDGIVVQSAVAGVPAQQSQTSAAEESEARPAEVAGDGEHSKPNPLAEACHEPDAAAVAVDSVQDADTAAAPQAASELPGQAAGEQPQTSPGSVWKCLQCGT